MAWRIRSLKRFSHVHRRAIVFSVFLGVLTCCVVYVRVSDSSFVRSLRFRLESALQGSVHFESNGFAIITPGCLLPAFDPWMEKTRHFFVKRSPARCPRTPENVLVSLEDSKLKIDPSAKIYFEKKRAGSSGSKRRWRKKGRKRPKRKLTCKKSTLHRRTVEENDTTYRIKRNFTEFDNETVMDSEFVQVECAVNGGYPVYRHFFYNVQEKAEVEASCASNAARFLSECRPPDCLCSRLPKDEPRLSVMLVGVDSVSKANFLRQFPQTHTLLTGIDFSAVDFAGYTKVGLNTFPCLMPYLTGQSETELTNGCWGGPTQFFDKCTTLFDVFAAAGHRTAFVENMANFGLFTYNKLGFRRQPAHYYGRTFYLPVLEHIRSFSSGCWRGMSDDEHVLKWALLYQKAFADRLHYGHFWVSRFAHDEINEAQRLDPPLSQLLRDTEPLIRNSTLLIVMSDHGIRYGPFRQTEVGRIEENLPFMYMIFPRWFREKYVKAMRNLKVNRQRLVTMYDLHATLSAIVNCDYGDDTASLPPLRQRAVSLFREVSPLRTCEEADIPIPYCSCHEGEDLRQDPASSASVALALLVVKAINNATSLRHGHCEELRLASIVSVIRMATTGSGSPPANDDGSFVVALRVAPGNATFEATVVRVGGNASVHPDIRRVNRYNDDSWCILDNHFLKSVCICKGERP